MHPGALAATVTNEWFTLGLKGGHDNEWEDTIAALKEKMLTDK
jgi:hypothetical protein